MNESEKNVTHSLSQKFVKEKGKEGKREIVCVCVCVRERERERESKSNAFKLDESERG